MIDIIWSLMYTQNQTFLLIMYARTSFTRLITNRYTFWSQNGSRHKSVHFVVTNRYRITNRSRSRIGPSQVVRCVFLHAYLSWSYCLFQCHIWYIWYVTDDIDIPDIFTRSSSIYIYIYSASTRAYIWYVTVIVNFFTIKIIYIYRD